MQVVISGYGKMGHMVEETLMKACVESIVVSEDIQSVDPEIAAHSICIDFTTPTAIRANYRWLAEHFKGVVIGTTGWDDIHDEVCRYFEQCGTTLIYASNFSIGVNLLMGAVGYLADKMGIVGGYKPYIVEMHHSHKIDAPSGTAKSLAKEVEQGMAEKPDIQSVRCGEIPGIHTVGFEGADDRIVITHEAFSRKGFAAGAVEAAFKADVMKGVYNFKDIIFDKEIAK